MNLYFKKLDHTDIKLSQSIPNALYTSKNLDYQKEYMKNFTFEDLSFAVYDNEYCIAYMLLTLAQDQAGEKQLNVFGLPAIYVELPACTQEHRTGLHNIVKDILTPYIDISLSYQEQFNNSGISFCAQFMLDNGDSCVNKFSVKINLSEDKQILWKNLRKSYKPLINKGLRNFTHTLLTSDNISISDIENFRQLHYEVSGRRTRSHASWLLQYDAIKNKQAFMYTVHDEHKLIGASYYLLSPLSCYYGVGAYRRELFDKPIAHASLWNAILYAKELGCRYFDIGEYIFPFRKNDYSEKEMSISHFKRGFGGDIQLKLHITK